MVITYVHLKHERTIVKEGKKKQKKPDTICLMKGIIMMIDNTKMNILNSNIAHHHHLHRLLNTVLEFDQIYYHIQKFDIAMLNPNNFMGKYNASNLQKRLL
jgi:hypothetical protein